MIKQLKKILLRSALLFKKNNESKILFYHDIHDLKKYSSMSTPLVLFKKHISILKHNNFEIVKEITQNKGQVKIQFDDGFKGIYYCLNYLVSHQIPIEIFLISSFIGKENYLNKSQILELKKTGLVTFSSHSHSHADLSKCDEHSLKDELNTSKSLIESITNQKIDSICYPFGKFSIKVIKQCQMLSYTRQYSSLPGSYHDLFLNKVYRRNLVQFADEKEFYCILKGAQYIFSLRYTKIHFSK